MNNFKGVFQNDNTNQAGYSYQDKKVKVQYSQHQMSSLTRAMMVTGIGFIATFLVGLLTEYIISVLISSQDIYDSFNSMVTLSIVTVVGLLVSFILTLIWSFRVYNASMSFAIFTITIYCIANGIGFGSLFYLVEYWEIIFAFGILGLVFLITFGIAKIISYKAALNLVKIAMIGTIVYFVLVLIVGLLNGFGILPLFSFEYSYLIIIAVSGFLSILYMIYELWVIQNLDKFYLDAQLTKKLSVFMGFQVLINLINLIWIFLRLFARR